MNDVQYSIKSIKDNSTVQINTVASVCFIALKALLSSPQECRRSQRNEDLSIHR